MATDHLQLIRDSISKEYVDQLNALPIPTCSLVETVLRFALGGECPEDASPDTKTRWKEQQSTLEQLRRKRPREEDHVPEAKKARTTTDEPALFTLHNFSVTSPIRKRVNISVHKSVVLFTNAKTGEVESSVLLSSLTHAFLLPTRGKAKPHWTIILLGSETQVVFGVDATPPPFETTDESGATLKHPKNTPVLPHLRTFLFHLPIPTIEPSLSVFKSALGETSGVEGYRGAKPGTLWFLNEGILWDASKTCEFWGMQNLAQEGVRTISATGRSCSVILTRKDSEQQPIDIQMVDGKEQEPIGRWVKANQRRFGKTEDLGTVAAEDDEDEEDEDYVLNSSDEDGGSATSSSSEDEGSGDEGMEAEAEESGDEEDEVEELDPARHPLLRPGAMPRMSKAALEAAVGIVQDEFLGGPEDESEGEDEIDEEDELED